MAVKYLGKGDFLNVLGYIAKWDKSNIELKVDVEFYHCDVCNNDFWLSDIRQKCLRKDVKCPMCTIKNQKRWWQLWKGGR